MKNGQPGRARLRILILGLNSIGNLWYQYGEAKPHHIGNVSAGVQKHFGPRIIVIEAAEHTGK